MKADWPMGMWDETCAVTHFSIFANDPCVDVVFDGGYGANRSRPVRARRLDAYGLAHRLCGRRIEHHREHYDERE